MQSQKPANAASHTKEAYLAAQNHRLAAKHGPKRAIMALAHSILVIAYYVIRRNEPYKELGGNYFEERGRAALANRLTSRLERLGYAVSIQQAVRERAAAQ